VHHSLSQAAGSSSRPRSMIALVSQASTALPRAASRRRPPAQKPTAAVTEPENQSGSAIGCVHTTQAPTDVPAASSRPQGDAARDRVTTSSDGGSVLIEVQGFCRLIVRVTRRCCQSNSSSCPGRSGVANAAVCCRPNAVHAGANAPVLRESTCGSRVAAGCYIVRHVGFTMHCQLQGTSLHERAWQKPAGQVLHRTRLGDQKAMHTWTS